MTTIKRAARFLLPVMAAVLCLASFSAVTLQPSGAQTGSSAGTWQAVPTGSQVAVMVDVTAASGTIAFDLWSQGANDSSDPNGWDVPADLVLLDSGGASATGTLTGPIRDIIDNRTSTSTIRATALYKVWPYKYIRSRWTLTGSTPSVTFAVTAGVK